MVKPLRVCMVGSGNFACAIVRNVGLNVAMRPEKFEEEVRMWVHEEEVDGQKVQREVAVAAIVIAAVVAVAASASMRHF